MGSGQADRNESVKTPPGLCLFVQAWGRGVQYTSIIFGLCKRRRIFILRYFAHMAHGTEPGGVALRKVITFRSLSFLHEFFRLVRISFIIIVFFLRSFLNRRNLWVFDSFIGQCPCMWAKKVGHFYPSGPGIVREMATSKPKFLNEVGRRLGSGVGWAWGLGQEVTPEWIYSFDIGEMRAVLVQEAGCEGLQSSMVNKAVHRLMRADATEWAGGCQHSLYLHTWYATLLMGWRGQGGDGSP